MAHSLRQSSPSLRSWLRLASPGNSRRSAPKSRHEVWGRPNRPELSRKIPNDGSFLPCAPAGAEQDEYAFYSGRAKGTFSVDVVITALACSCDVYLLPQLTWAGTTFDSDYGSMVESQLWPMHAAAGQWATLASSQSATRTTSLIGDFDTFTPDLHGISCSNLDERGCHVDVDGCSFIFKWTFTNSN